MGVETKANGALNLQLPVPYTRGRQRLFFQMLEVCAALVTIWDPTDNTVVGGFTVNRFGQ
jgi:hypothetical protein